MITRVKISLTCIYVIYELKLMLPMYVNQFNNSFTPKLKPVLKLVFLITISNCFPHTSCINSCFSPLNVHLALKIQVSNYLKAMGNGGFYFSVSDFHSVKLTLTKHVLLVRICSTYFQRLWGRFVDFRCSTLKLRVSNYSNLMENSVQQSSVSDFYSVKPTLTKYVLLV